MTPGDSPKRQVFTHLARIAKAMASPNRLELIELLAQGERPVERLAEASGLSVANTSHHLQVLREGGLVRSRREGVLVLYSLSDEEIPRLLGCLRRVGERHLAEIERIVRQHFTEEEGLRPVDHQELAARLRSGGALLIDVRPPEEYEAGHIPGAVNIPLKALPKRLANLPKGKEIVAYCRGPYCLLAVEAVKRLRKHGYRARRLEEGFPEWKAKGRPVAVGK